VENATLPQARRVALTLAELPRISDYGFEGPTVIMLGAVFGAALAERTDSGILLQSRMAVTTVARAVVHAGVPRLVIKVIHE
jgi:siroheme synthase